MARRGWRTLIGARRGRGDVADAPDALLELARRGAAPLAPRVVGTEDRLAIATLIPSFRRGSGGHATIVRILSELRRRGHEISVWLEDSEGRHAREGTGVTGRSFGEFFAAEDIPFRADLREFEGADIVLATGWQTVPRALLLEGAGGRAYLVQDHEPEFYGTSSEALWAEQTYRQGLHCIAASAWLADLLTARYGAHASHFDLGVDHDVYRPARHTPDQAQTVLFYARAVTPRRAVPLGLLALRELARRRPGIEIVLYGESAPLAAPFPHRNLGMLPAERLAALYAQASVGMVLSMTNPSLIGLEMMACGLACVELASDSMLATFGGNGPLELAAADPLELCNALERMLDDERHRGRAVADGLSLVAARTWASAAEQVERGLRAAISLPGPAPVGDRDD